MYYFRVENLPIFAGREICRILRMKTLSKVLPLFWPSYEMVRYLLFRKILKSQKLLGWNQHFQSIPLIEWKVSKSGWDIMVLQFSNNLEFSQKKNYPDPVINVELAAKSQVVTSLLWPITFWRIFTSWPTQDMVFLK